MKSVCEGTLKEGYMKDLGQDSIEKYVTVWEVTVFKMILYSTFFCLFILKQFLFLVFQ